MAAPTALDAEVVVGDATLTGSMSAGDLAIVVVWAWNNDAATVSCSISGNSLSWTQREIEAFNANKHIYICVAYATFASAATASVTVDVTNTDNVHAALYRLPGGSYVQHKTGSGDTWSSNPTTFSITLDSAPSSANGVLAAFGVLEAFDGQNTVAPVSGWTELAGIESGALGDLSSFLAWREGSTSSTVAVDFNNDEYVEALVAVEFSLGASGTTATPSQGAGSSAGQGVTVRTSGTVGTAAGSTTSAGGSPGFAASATAGPAQGSSTGSGGAPNVSGDGYYPGTPGVLGPRTVDISTQGTVRDANSAATIVSQINASSAGDTVRIAAGTYGDLTVPKSIASGLIRIVPATAGTVTIASIDMDNAQGLDWRGINTTGAAWGNVYFRNSKRCRVRGGTHTNAAAQVFDIRRLCDDVLIEDVTVEDSYMAFNVTAGAGETVPRNIALQHFRSENVSRDHLFLSRGEWITVQDFECYGITEDVEHQDGVQIVGAKHVMIRRGHIWNDRSFRDGAIDRNDHGIIVNYDPAETPDGRVPEDIHIENMLIHDMTSRGITIAGVQNGLTIRNVTSYDNGASGTGEGLTMDPDSGNIIEDVTVVNSVFNTVYWTTLSGATPVLDYNFVADASGSSTNELTGSPGFLDSANQDYRLTAASQNRGSGSAAYGPTEDVSGSTRPSPPSRGFSEELSRVATPGQGASSGSGQGVTVTTGGIAGSAGGTTNGTGGAAALAVSSKAGPNQGSATGSGTTPTIGTSSGSANATATPGTGTTTGSGGTPTIGGDAYAMALTRYTCPARTRRPTGTRSLASLPR